MWTGCIVFFATFALVAMTRPRLARAAYGFVALAAAILYFALPSSITDEEVINGRMAAVTMVFVAAWVPFAWDRRAKQAALAIAVAATVACGIVYANATARFADEQAGLSETLAAAPPGGKLIAQDLPQSKVYRVDVFRHVGSYQVVWNHGLVANTFATRSVQPIQVTDLWRSEMRTGNQDVILSGKTIPDKTLLAHNGSFYLYSMVSP
jgi:hypothetical protein